MTFVKEKSRKLSLYEFFEVLQVEWIVCDLRYRLYTMQKDKEYWKKVRDGKRKTIEEIAENNMLPTIFTDTEMKSEFEHRVYRTEGFPNFHYKNEDQKNNQGYLDLFYYYSKGAEVRFEIFGEIKVGKIKKYQPYSKNIHVETNSGSIEQINIDSVRRIL